MQLIDNSIVELEDVKNVLDLYANIDDKTKSDILNQLMQKAQVLKEETLQTTDSPEQNSESEIEKENTPKIKKQWGILISDPLNTISQEYMGWCFQMDEDENIADATDKIINAAGEFNRSKKGSKNPVKTIGETIMYVPSKFFKEQKIYMKSKEPVYINITNNSLISNNA